MVESGIRTTYLRLSNHGDAHTFVLYKTPTTLQTWTLQKPTTELSFFWVADYAFFEVGMRLEVNNYRSILSIPLNVFDQPVYIKLVKA